MLAPQHLNSEIDRRRNSIYKYRYLEPTRVQQSITNLAPYNTYDIRLTSISGYSAYLLCVVRPSVITFANQNTYQPLLKLELLDKDGNIIGITQDSLGMQIISEQFAGYMLDIKPNIFLLPFCMDVKGALMGQMNGLYKFNTGQEVLRLYTEGTITPGSYQITIYSYDYQTLELNKGMISSYKF